MVVWAFIFVCFLTELVLFWSDSEMRFLSSIILQIRIAILFNASKRLGLCDIVLFSFAKSAVSLKAKWRKNEGFLPNLLNQKQSFGENESTIILNGRGEEHQKDDDFENLGHGAQGQTLA